MTSAAVGFTTAILLCLPFGSSPVGLFRAVAKAAGGYPYVSVNAYNPWALLSKDGYGLAENGFYNRSGMWPARSPTRPPRSSPAFQPCTSERPSAARIVAVCAIVAISRRTALVLDLAPAVRSGRRRPPPARRGRDVPRGRVLRPADPRPRALSVPAFAVGAILAATSVRWRIAYVVLALASFANLYGVLLTPFFKNPGITDWLRLGDAIRSQPGVTFVVIVHVAALRLDRHGAPAPGGPSTRRRGADRRALGTGGGRGRDRADRSDRGRWRPTARAGLATRPGDGLGRDARRLEPRRLRIDRRLDRRPADAPEGWRPPPAERGPAGLPLPFGLGRGRTLLPDRSRRLHGEGGGRFDRLDLWFFVVLVVLALVTADVPPVRAVPDALRRGLSRPDRDRVPPGLALRDAARHLRVHPPAPRQVRDGGRVDRRRRRPGHGQRAARDPGPRRPRRAAAGSIRSRPGGRAGDRFYVADRRSARAYDLQTRKLVATWSVPGAASLALDPDGHRVLVGTDGGAILALDTARARRAARDAGRSIAHRRGTGPGALAEIGAPVTRIALTDDGTGLAAATSDGEVVAIDPNTGDELGRARFDGLTDLADGGQAEGLTADLEAVADPAAAAAALAAITGGDATELERRLSAKSAGDPSQIVILPGVDADQRDTIEAAITDGRLEGSALTPLPLIAVSEATGVSFISPATADVVASVGFDAPARGMAKVTGIDKPTLYVALGDDRLGLIQLGEADGKTRPRLDTTVAMPGDVRRVIFDEPTGMVHVLGSAPDGSGDTIYVIEPHGNAVFADARLPFGAAAWALDANGDHPSGDRQSILVASAGGSLATVDTGNARVRLAPPRRPGRSADGRTHLPARPDPLPETRDRGHRRHPRPRRRDALRPEPDRDERRLRRAVHRRRLHPVRPALDGPLAQSMGVLGRASVDRGPARPGPRLEVDRAVCHRRDRGPHPRPVGPRADLADPRAGPRDDGPRLHGHDRAGRRGDERGNLSSWR